MNDDTDCAGDCTEDGCNELATLERPECMIGEDILMMMVCADHGPEWLRP